MNANFDADTQRHRKIIDNLHNTGIDRWIKLPQIAVIGDTSSGKSSLLSNISLIPFASSDEVCTRCPTRLRMECRAGPFEAKINIQWHDHCEYKSSEWGPKCLQSMTEIAKYIMEAQAYIFKQAGRDIKTDVCKDIIEVEVYMSGCTDLTLIDLPGIVRSVADDENPSLPKEIEGLIREYLSNERCVILAVQPANVDFHNSQI